MAKDKPASLKPLSAQRFAPVASTSKTPTPKATSKDVISLLTSDEEEAPKPVKRAKPKVARAAPPDDLWVDRYQPIDLTELSVHKKKVEDVKHWLQEALENQLLARYRRVLVLSGPAGTGKTATVQCLAKDMNFELLEYKSGEEGGADALTMHFTAFMARASSVPTLQFTSDEPIKSESKRRKKVILVEDLPNIFSSEVTRSAFRNTLIGFVKAHRGTATAVPMVLIISAALSRPSTDNEWAAESYNWNDNVSVRSILPPEILKGGKCTEIKFNPVADTILKKGLELMLDKALSEKKALRPSAPAVAAVVRSANGDIRSAVNNLQFLVREGKHAGLKIMEQAPAKGKKRARSGKFKDDDDAELSELIHGRETSIFIFHALGKVLYSKRWGEKPDEDEKELKKIKREPPPKTDPLPKHLRSFKRKLSKVDPNVLFASAPVDSDLFTAYLHQNYTQFMTDTDECSNAMEYLSMSDALMRMEGESFARHSLTSQYSFHVSVRGMMMSLPAPVPRKGQKMFKAELWDRNRKMRDNAASVHTLVPTLSRAYGKSTDNPPGLTTRRILVNELLAYPSLIAKLGQLDELPAHVLALAKELPTFKNLHSSLQVMDEDELEKAEDGDIGLIGAADDVEDEELLYLPEDDIMDFD